MAQRINVRAHMPAEGQRLRSRAAAVGHNVIAVHLGQAEQEWRVRRMVRHADKIGLSQIVETGVGEQFQQ